MGEDSFFSGFQELDTPPITLRSHGEMYPVAPVPVALDKQFIEVLLPVISRIEQYCCITDGLLNTIFIQYFHFQRCYGVTALWRYGVSA